MRLLADQNVHRRVVVCLRDAGFDVEFILEAMPGRSDQHILARADIGEFVLITGDKGFGDWIFNKGLGRPLAIILSRLPQPEWATTARRVMDVLEGPVVPGQIITVTRDGDRIRPFPLGVRHA